MKKSEFIQILEQGGTKVFRVKRFKSEDSETIRQLTSILRHPHVINLPDDAQLPSEAIAAVRKAIDEATNVGSQTQAILDSLRQQLPHSAVSTNSSSAQGDSNSNAVAATSTSQASAKFDPSQSDFWYASTEVVNEIFDWLPAEKDEPKTIKTRRAFFRVFATSNKEGFEPVRQGVVNGMQQPFLQVVADAEMKSAEAILKLAMVNKPMLQKLLTTTKTIIQRNGLPVTGTALEIALKCWDWSSCEGGQEEMAEMLMRYMRMLPDGEQLIQTTFTKLFPKGHEAHEQDQKNRAKEFAERILEPLAKTLKDASDADITLVEAIAVAELDDYINKHLAENKLWQALMVYHEAIKEFMIKDNVYNPLYLKKAFEIAEKKYEKENWIRLSKGFERHSLLTFHGVGGIQACSPTLVGMLFARGGIYDYNDMNESDRKKFIVDRDCKFKYWGGDIFARSGVGVLLVSKKFVVMTGAGKWQGRTWPCRSGDWRVGVYMPDKNTALGSQSQSLLQFNQQRVSV